MLFATKYTIVRTPPEVNSGPNLVERAGYIPAQVRIENMMAAGQRLIAHRAEMYDFKNMSEIDENFIDPTRSKNFDLADATMIQQNIEANRRQAEILKASPAAQDGSGDVSSEGEGGNVSPEK